MDRLYRVLCVLILLTGLIAWSCGSVAAAPAGAKAARSASGHVVLALFKSSEKDTAESNLCKRYAAGHLQKAGYQVEYRDIEAGYPSEAEMARYAAVLTWFRGAQMKEALAYPTWLARQVKAGRKVVVLGNFGAYTPDMKYFTPDTYLNEFFVPFGLQYRGRWTGKASLLKVVHKVAAMVESPSPIDLAAINHYLDVESRLGENTSFLTVERTDVPDSKSALVVRTPHGGMAMEGYLYTGDPEQASSWHLNLGAFLRETIASKGEATGLASKRILAFYKSSEKVNERDNEIRLYAWETLYKLGYEVDFRDVDQGWPALSEMTPYTAIITWYRGATMPRAADYAEWLADNMAQGRRVIVLGNYGAFQERIDGPQESYQRWLGLEEYNNFFAPFGLEFQRQWTNDTKVLKVSSKDARMVEFQIPLTAADVKHYYKWQNLHPKNEPYLVLNRSDIPDGDSPVVVRTVGGGFALESYILESKPPDWVLKWRLNLPVFLERCLAQQLAEPPQPLLQKASDEELLQVPGNVSVIQFPRYAASALPADATELKRTVLGLYKSSEHDNQGRNLVHDRCEVILNHLGVKVAYHDIEQGLPSDEQMAPYAGVVTWFRDSYMDDPEAYAAWVRHQVEQGRKMVILGDPGLHIRKIKMVTTPGERALYQALGMRYVDPEATIQVVMSDERTQRGRGYRKLGGKGSRILYKDEKMVEFEMPLNLSEVRELSRVHSIDKRNKVYLSVNVARWGRTDPVVVGPFGGLADLSFAYYEPPPASSSTIKPDQEEEEEPPGRWRINPFLFFGEALGLHDTPRLDVTTLNGSRVFYSHIDGDGFPGISLIDKASLAADYIYRQILKVYPLPVSASVISKDIETRNRKYYNRELLLARKIYQLYNVEPATHTYSHPFNWRRGDLNVTAIDPVITMEKVPTDFARQITYSVNFINRYLLPPGKRVEILLWTGNCTPDEAAITVVDQNGLRNLNGGDPVMDKEHPTYSTLCGLSAQVGNRTQYLTSARGEFLYTDGWTKNYDGMKKLLDHYARTESPRRIMPVNIYFHFYVGDRQLGLDGLKVPFDYAMRTHVAPLFASQYVDSVSDWLTARIFRKGEGWVVVNSGTCRTVRFDLKGRHVDMDRSQGVLGYMHINDSLYVHLDDSNTHEIYLADKAPGKVHLVRGTHYVNQWKPSAGGVEFGIRGLGPGFFVIGGLKAGQAIPVVVRRADDPESGAVVTQKTVTVDKDGRLNFETQLVGYNRTYSVSVGAPTAGLPDHVGAGR